MVNNWSIFGSTESKFNLIDSSLLFIFETNLIYAKKMEDWFIFPTPDIEIVKIWQTNVNARANF